MQVSEQQFDVAQDALFREFGETAAATDGGIGDEVQRPRVERGGGNRLNALVEQGQIVGMQPQRDVFGGGQTRHGIFDHFFDGELTGFDNAVGQLGRDGDGEFDDGLLQFGQRFSSAGFEFGD